MLKLCNALAPEDLPVHHKFWRATKALKSAAHSIVVPTFRGIRQVLLRCVLRFESWTSQMLREIQVDQDQSTAVTMVSGCLIMMDLPAL